MNAMSDHLARARAAARELPHVESARGQSPLDLVGNTPLLRLDSLSREAGATVLAKAEWTNPGGSVKDRAAAAIVADALRNGKLPKGVSLLDSTSGNTGIAYAMIGAALGISVTLCVPDNVSIERKRILGAYGAHVIWTDGAEGSAGAIRRARELAAENPTATTTPTSTAIPRTGRRIIAAQRKKSGSRPKARSRILWRCSAPAARSSARHDG
jgi:Cysteine synthase